MPRANTSLIRFHPYPITGVVPAIVLASRRTPAHSPTFEEREPRAGSPRPYYERHGPKTPCPGIALRDFGAKIPAALRNPPALQRSCKDRYRLCAQLQDSKRSNPAARLQGRRLRSAGSATRHRCSRSITGCTWFHHKAWMNQRHSALRGEGSRSVGPIHVQSCLCEVCMGYILLCCGYQY